MKVINFTRLKYSYYDGLRLKLLSILFTTKAIFFILKNHKNSNKYSIILKSDKIINTISYGTFAFLSEHIDNSYKWQNIKNQFSL